MHPGHSQVLRVRVGKGATRHEGRHERSVRRLDERTHLLARARTKHTTAQEEHGALRVHEQLDRFADLLAVGAPRDAIAGKIELFGPFENGFGLLRILRHVYEHDSRPACRGDVESLFDRERNVIRVLDEDVVLRHGHRHAHDVGLLERVRTNKTRTHLTGDDHHGDRVHLGIRNRGDEVCRAGPRGRDTHAYLAGCMRVPARRVARALLVTHENVPKPLRIEKRIVGREDRSPGQAKHDVRPRRFERHDERLRSRDCSSHNASNYSLTKKPLVPCGKSRGAAYRAGALAAPGHNKENALHASQATRIQILKRNGSYFEIRRLLGTVGPTVPAAYGRGLRVAPNVAERT